jgi:hypothetical protein
MTETTTETTEAPAAEATEEKPAAAAAPAEQTTNANEAEDLLGDTEAPKEEATEGEKGEKKTDAEKSDAKGDDKGEVDGAPETYEDFVLPEGIERDEAGLEEFSALAKEFDLPQAAAQKLVDLQASVVQRQADAAWQVWADKQNEWAKEVRNDKELGGDNIAGSKAAAKAFVLKFGGEEALEILRLTGASNHPKVFGALARAGKELAEDEIVPGNTGGVEPTSRAKTIFPTMN